MTKTAHKKLDIEKTIFLGLSCLCLSLFIMYVYFLSASVVHVVVRTETNQDITMISSSISELEGKYIEAQNRVSSDIASLQGYEKTDAKIFINKNSGNLVLNTVKSR